MSREALDVLDREIEAAADNARWYTLRMAKAREEVAELSRMRRVEMRKLAALGLSQRYIAKRLGVSQALVSKILRG